MIAHRIIDPMNRYKVGYDIIIGIFYLITLIIDPVVYAFHYVPLEQESLNNFVRLINIVFIIDIFVTIFTGI